MSAKEIRERLAWIGRYTSDISPKLAVYRSLMAEKNDLREQLYRLEMPARKKFTKPL